VKKKLILPIAGESTRFQGMRPKWLLTHPKGTLMLTESIRGIEPDRFDILIVGLAKHDKRYRCRQTVLKEFEREYPNQDVEYLLLEKQTNNHPHTVYEGLKRLDVSGPILIKDCDNFFKAKTPEDDINYVMVSDLHELNYVTPGNKSYVQMGQNNTIGNIVEKKVISNLFCCGGYFFREAKEFIKYYLALSNNKKLYISHIIYKMLLDKKLFFIKKTHNYIDWGTSEDWLNYKKQFSTIFVDIDGTLTKSSGEHFEPFWGTTEALAENVKVINELYDSGKAYIILTTGRKTQYRNITKEQMKRMGLKYHRMLMNLPSSKRVLINDYTKTSPFPTAIAINLKRDTEQLREKIECII